MSSDWTQCAVTPTVNHTGFDSLGVAVYRASTIPFPSAHAYATRRERGDDGYSYGLYGTPTTRTLEQKITTLAQGVRTFLVPSGQAAISIVMTMLLRAGDQVLIPDTVYPPVRELAKQDLARFGIETLYYDPMDIDALDALINARTRLVWVESPGSTTMEVQDLPRIAELAHAHGALVGCDNTWATPLFYKPLTHGADIVIEGLTKYFCGHSDVLMGSITVRDPAIATQLRTFLGRMGIGASPDDSSLILRGLETLAVRMAHTSGVASRVIALIQGQPSVLQVLHPSQPGSPGHDIWKRDFLGASGVFSVVFAPEVVSQVAAALDVFKLFVIGASWGGTRSLVAPMPVSAHRSVRPWVGDDLVLRVSIGLEDEAELTHDLQAFFDHLNTFCTKAAAT